MGRSNSTAPKQLGAQAKTNSNPKPKIHIPAVLGSSRASGSGSNRQAARRGDGSSRDSSPLSWPAPSAEKFKKVVYRRSPSPPPRSRNKVGRRPQVTIVPPLQAIGPNNKTRHELQSSRRSSAGASGEGEVIEVLSDAPIETPKDKLDKAIDLMDKELGPQVVDQAISLIYPEDLDKAKSSSSALTSSPVGVVSATSGHEKKRPADKDANPEGGLKRPCSPLGDNAPGRDDISANLVKQAKELHIMAEKHFEALVSHGPTLPLDMIPPVTDGKPGEKPRFHLPTSDPVSERYARIVRMDLEAIQRHLTKKPLSRGNLLQEIEMATTAWAKMYDGVFPDDLLQLDALLKSLSHRLAGTKNPDDYEEKDVTFADKVVRPFLKKLVAAHADASQQLTLVEGDRPKLESRRAELAASRERLQREAEEHEKLAILARKREAAARRSGEAVVHALAAYNHAVARSTERLNAMAQRREEVEAFLRRLDRQTKTVDPDNPPEAEMILAYSSS